MNLDQMLDSMASRAAAPTYSGRMLQFLTILTQNWTRLPIGICLLLIPVACAQGANWYVTPSGGGNGTSWSSAWTPSTIGWSSVSTGDTIWLAGGTYSSTFSLTSKSGTSGSPITIMRVRSTNSVPVAASGWNSSYDSQVVLPNGPGTITANYITVNGQIPNGIRWPVPGSGSTDIGTSASPVIFSSCTGVTVANVYFVGPGWITGGYYSYAVWFYACTSCTLTYCTIDGVLQQISMNGASSPVIDHCTLVNCGPVGLGHPDVLYVNGFNELTFRYNTVSNVQSECLFFDFGGGGNAYFYGNVMIMGANGSQNAIQPKQGYSWGGSWLVYNNTFVNWAPACLWRGTFSTAPIMKNNIFWNSSWGEVGDYSGPAPVSMFNGYSSANQDSSGGYVSSTDPFVNSAAGNYHLTTGSWPINRGTTLGAPYNMDKDGNTRGADGTFDMGAYEYGSVSTNPVISVSPAVLAFGALLAGQIATNYFTVQNVGGGTLAGSAAISGATTNVSIVSGQSYSLGASQSAQIGIRYTPGSASDSAVVTFTGGGGTSANVTGQLQAVLPGLSFQSYAGIITAPFTTNGGYISQSVDVSNSGQAGVTNGGRAVYAFNISTSGNYTVSANVNAPNAASKSFWVNMDALPTDPTMIWDVYPYTSGFANRTVSWRGSGTATNDQFAPQIFTLAAGMHQLIIVGREAGVQLGQLTVAPYDASHPAPPAPPSNLRIAASQ